MPSFRCPHYAWVILFTCFVNLFINYAVQLGYGVILPEMIQELNFSRTAAGTIFNAYLVIYIALTPLTGYLADRLGARRIITAGALILGIGTVLMGTVQTLWMACAVYILVGIGATGMWIPIIALVQRDISRWRIKRYVRQTRCRPVLNMKHGRGSCHTIQ